MSTLPELLGYYIGAVIKQQKTQRDQKVETKPCVGCGHCCFSGPCVVALVLHGVAFPWSTSRCPQLVWDEKGKRHLCIAYPWRTFARRLGVVINGSDCILPSSPWRKEIKDRTTPAAVEGPGYIKESS